MTGIFVAVGAAFLVAFVPMLFMYVTRKKDEDR